MSSAGLVYVGNFDGTVSIINPSNNYSVSSVAVCSRPSDIAFNTVNGKVYIPCAAAFPNNKISIIDPAHNNATSFVYSSTAYAGYVAIDQSSGTVYVSATNGSYGGKTNVTAIDPTTSNTTSIPAGVDTGSIAVNMTTHIAYALNVIDKTVTVIVPSGSTYTTTTVALGTDYPSDLTLDGNGKVYVPANKTLFVLDPARSYASSSISYPTGLKYIAYDRHTNKMILTGGTSQTNYFTNLSTSATTALTLGNNPQQVTASQTRGESYIVNSDGDTVSVVTD